MTHCQQQCVAKRFSQGSDVRFHSGNAWFWHAVHGRHLCPECPGSCDWTLPFRGYGSIATGFPFEGTCCSVEIWSQTWKGRAVPPVSYGGRVPGEGFSACVSTSLPPLHSAGWGYTASRLLRPSNPALNSQPWSPSGKSLRITTEGNLERCVPSHPPGSAPGTSFIRRQCRREKNKTHVRLCCL